MNDYQEKELLAHISLNKHNNLLNAYSSIDNNLRNSITSKNYNLGSNLTSSKSRPPSPNNFPFQPSIPLSPLISPLVSPLLSSNYQQKRRSSVNENPNLSVLIKSCKNIEVLSST